MDANTQGLTMLVYIKRFVLVLELCQGFTSDQSIIPHNVKAAISGEWEESDGYIIMAWLNVFINWKFSVCVQLAEAASNYGTPLQGCEFFMGS